MGSYFEFCHRQRVRELFFFNRLFLLSFDECWYLEDTSNQGKWGLNL